LQQQAAERSRDWVARIQDGDRAAESELVSYYTRGVRLLLLKRTGKPDLAMDLCQDTLVIVLRRLRAGELRSPEALSAFIRQTAVNLTIEHFRREKRYVEDEGEIISLHAAPRDHKDKEIDSRTTRALLDRTLDQLAVERDREILRRFYLREEDKESICSDLELSATHFDRVLYRARQRMRELIDQQQGLKSLLFGGLLDG
jgi:RNA polymerase sigma-70 factor (ECF subfamily)